MMISLFTLRYAATRVRLRLCCGLRVETVLNVIILRTPRGTTAPCTMREFDGLFSLRPARAARCVGVAPRVESRRVALTITAVTTTTYLHASLLRRGGGLMLISVIVRIMYYVVCVFLCLCFLLLT